MSKNHIALAALLASIFVADPSTNIEAQEVAMSDVPAIHDPVVTETAPPPSVGAATPAETFPRVVVQGAVLCWNESGENQNDCSTILQMRMRSARQHHRTLEEELYYLHGDGRTKNRERAALRSDRATNPSPRDRRAWLGDIAADLHQPRGWNEAVYPWERMRPRMLELFRFVQRVIDGQEPSRCRGGVPVRWGGRHVDHRHIQRHLDRGEVIIDCGMTVNVFLGRRNS